MKERPTKNIDAFNNAQKLPLRDMFFKYGWPEIRDYIEQLEKQYYELQGRYCALDDYRVSQLEEAKPESPLVGETLELSARVVQLEAQKKNHGNWLNELEKKNKKLKKAHKALEQKRLVDKGSIEDLDRQIQADVFNISELEARLDKLDKPGFPIELLNRQAECIDELFKHHDTHENQYYAAEIIGLLKDISDQLNRMDA